MSESLSTQIARLVQNGKDAVTSTDVAISFTNINLCKFMQVGVLVGEHAVKLPHNVSTVQTHDSVVWMIALQLLATDRQLSPSGLSAAILAWYNEISFTKHLARDAVGTECFKTSLKVTGILIGYGYLCEEQVLVTTSMGATKAHKASESLNAELDKVLAQLREDAPMKMEPLVEAPEPWTSNENGIHRDANRVCEKRRRVEQPQYDAANVLQAVALSRYEPFVEVGQVIEDNLEWCNGEPTDDPEAVFPSKLTAVSKFNNLPVRFWLAASKDSRGRGYALGGLTSHQSFDFLRAGICFADAKPLGESGYMWLALNVANHLDQGKLSYVDQLDWVMDHRDQLLEIGDTEDFCRRYPAIKKPYGAWAAIHEWQRATLFEGDVRTFESALIIHRDGTTNGIQHMAALTGCALSASVVNISSTTKEDFVKSLTQDVLDDLTSDERGHKEADAYRKGGVDMIKACVTPLMYGASPKGLAYTLIDGYASKGITITWAACFLITKVVCKHAPALSKFLSFMDRAILANGLSSRQRPVRWVLPDGFIAEQFYRDNTFALVRSTGYTAQFKPSVELPVDARKMVQALAPNFIHSLDGYHMRDTVMRCHARGVPLCTIHDSFGCHASDVDIMIEELQASFTDLHNGKSMETLASLLVDLGGAVDAPKWRRTYEASCEEALYMFS